MAFINTPNPSATSTSTSQSTDVFQHPNETGPGECKALQIFPRMHLLQPGEPIAVDFEYQNFRRQGEPKAGFRVGSVAVVNTKGETILDCCVRYERENGVRPIMPPERFGVTFESLQLNNGAIPAGYAEAWLAEIMAGRTVVVHGGSGDLLACQTVNPFLKAKEVVDTQHMYGKSKLCDLFARIFPNSPGVQQGGIHTATEDADSTMKLYLHRRPYDRAAEKRRLEGQGKAVVCKASALQVRQVKEMRVRHQRAAFLFTRNASNVAGNKTGGNGGGGGGGLSGKGGKDGGAGGAGHGITV